MTRKPEYVNIDTIKGKQRNAQLENEKTRVKNSLGRCQDHAVVYGLEDDFNAWLKKIAVDYQVLKAKSAKAGK